MQYADLSPDAPVPYNGPLITPDRKRELTAQAEAFTPELLKQFHGILEEVFGFAFQTESDVAMMAGTRGWDNAIKRCLQNRPDMLADYYCTNGDEDDYFCQIIALRMARQGLVVMDVHA